MVINEDEEKIEMIDSKTLYVRKFSKDTHLGMVTRAKTKDELDKYYREYLNMPMAQKFKADNMAVRIFGKTNEELYHIYKRDFVFDTSDLPDHIDNSTDKNLGIDNDMFSNTDTEIHNDIVVRDVDKETFVGQIRESMYLENVKPDEPTLNNFAFFSPLELLQFGEDFYSNTPDNIMLTENISVLEWFENYVNSFNGFICENYSIEWSNKLRELYSDYNQILESEDQEKINNRKQSILNLCWNPEIEFNENNIIIGKKRLLERAKFVQDQYMDYSNIIPTEEMVFTESVNTNKHSAIYIVLTKGETPIISDGIRLFTNSEYSHAGISFNDELNEVYSYNMKKDSRGQNGFVIENIKDNNAIQSVFVFFLEKHKVRSMMDTVKDYEAHVTKYDFGMLFGKAVNATNNNTNKYNQVCSNFVNVILKSGSVEFVTTKNNSIASPADIYNSIMKMPNKVYKVFEGRGVEYNASRTRDIIAKLIHNKNINSIDESTYIEEKAKPNICYKITYEGQDVFNELKMAIFNRTRNMKEYEKFCESDKCNWLKITNTKKVYLTEKGFKKFNKSIKPMIGVYLDKKKLKVDTYVIDQDRINYKDEYQITTKKPLMKLNEDYIEEYYNPKLYDEEKRWVVINHEQHVANYESVTKERCVRRFDINEQDYSPYQKILNTEHPHNPDPNDFINEDLYIISDPHFTKYDSNYDKQMIELFNSVPIGKHLLVLGDISYIKTQDPNNAKVIRNIFRKIHCENMYLILGNHDCMPIEYYYSLGFKGVYDRITIDSKKWIFSHQYCDGLDPTYINFHGHIHEELGYVQYIRSLKDKINCWSGYCNKKAKTISEWIEHNKTMNNKKFFIPINENYYTTTGIYIDESVEDYMESKDIAFNIDRWNNDETNVMFVTGASGSGKSTIAEKVAKEVDGEWIPLDAFFKYAFIKNYNQEFSDWMLKSKPSLVSYINMIGRPNIVNHEVNSWDDLEEYPDDVKKSILKLVAYLKSKAPKKFIIEGYQIGRFMKPSDLENEPLIVKGTTFSKTQFRRVARELSNKNSKGNSPLEKIKNAATIFRYNVDEYDNWKSEYDHITKFGKDYGKTYHEDASINDYIDESVEDYFENKDEGINIDKWESGESNLMFVTGLSGSGKSTIAKKICEEYNAEYVELDDVYGATVLSKRQKEYGKVINRYISEIGEQNVFGGIKDLNMFDFVRKHKQIFDKEYQRFIDWIIAYAEHNKNSRFVVEGSFFFQCDIKAETIEDYPIIFKGTALNTTLYRRIARSTKKKNPVKKTLKSIKYTVKNYDELKRHDTLYSDYRDTFKQESLDIQNESISMDDEGNMLIYRATLNTINYGDEIKKSADLCKLYKESSNLEGLKYELCKLWYINAMLEKRIKRNDKRKDEYYGYRRICMNVFKTYMKHVNTLDDDFNFTAYYNSTPYGGAIKIDKNTLKYSIKALKELLR